MTTFNRQRYQIAASVMNEYISDLMHSPFAMTSEFECFLEVWGQIQVELENNRKRGENYGTNRSAS